MQPTRPASQPRRQPPAQDVAPLAARLVEWAHEHVSPAGRRSLAALFGQATGDMTDAGVLTVLGPAARAAMAEDPEVRRAVLRAAAEEASGPRRP
jgi:hypothetical protein